PSVRSAVSTTIRRSLECPARGPAARWQVSCATGCRECPPCCSVQPGRAGDDPDCSIGFARSAAPETLRPRAAWAVRPPGSSRLF
nr:hypothetical protein [Tanacetum cinerariifolium]